MEEQGGMNEQLQNQGSKLVGGAAFLTARIQHVSIS